MFPSLESIALELLEYKVEEYRAKRTVRGGTSSLWDLLALLSREQDRLSSEQRQRLEAVSRDLATLSDRPAARQVPSLNALVLDDEAAVEVADAPEPLRAESLATTPEERAEQAVLLSLARRVWWDDLEEFVMRVAAGWRAEPERRTARLMFGVLQNLHRNSDRSTFGKDVELRRFRVVEPIPGLRDPLVALSDIDALAEIARELINLIMTLGKPGNPLPALTINEGGAFAYVRQAALTVAADPYAGRLAPSSPNDVTSRQLKLAIQELVKERLPEEEKAKQRRQLEARLIEVAARERTERQAFQQETAAFRELAINFFDRLAEYLPTNVGGRASGPQLEGGVLFGANPILRWEKVPPDATAVTIRMVGPVRLNLAGHDLAIAGVGASRTLYVDGHEMELEGTNVLKRDRTWVATYREGDYVHVRFRDLEKSLAARLADALVSAYVLTDQQSEEMLATLKVLANNVRGEPHEVVAQAITRAGVVTARAPDRAKAIDGLLRGSARAAGVGLVDHAVEGLVTRILASLEGDAHDLSEAIAASGATEHEVQPLTGEPLTFEVGGHRITVRQYRGRGSEAQASLVAMVPGQVLGSFTQYLITPRPDGTLVFARGESEVAVLFLARAATDAGALV